MPSASIAAPSITKVPNTRLVKKPRESLTTIGDLADRLHVVEGARHGLVVGLLAADDLDQLHLVAPGEKKWRPTKFSGRALALARPLIGSVEVLRREQAARREHRLGLLRDLRLQLAVLEHRLDDQVAAVQVVPHRRSA